MINDASMWKLLELCVQIADHHDVLVDDEYDKLTTFVNTLKEKHLKQDFLYHV